MSNSKKGVEIEHIVQTKYGGLKVAELVGRKFGTKVTITRVVVGTTVTAVIRNIATRGPLGSMLDSRIRTVMLSSRSCPILAEAVAGKKGGSGSSSDLRYRYLKKRNRTKFWTILLKINLSLFVKYWKSKSKTLVPFYEWNMSWKSRKGYFSTLFTAKMVDYRAGAEAGADIVTSWSWSRVKIVLLHNSLTTGNPLCSFFSISSFGFINIWRRIPDPVTGWKNVQHASGGADPWLRLCITSHARALDKGLASQVIFLFSKTWMLSLFLKYNYWQKFHLIDVVSWLIVS